MNKSRDHLELAFKSIQCFHNNGRLDAEELCKLVEIAERDGVIDQDEIRVLRNIIAKIKPEEVDAAMRKRLDELSAKIGSGNAGQS